MGRIGILALQGGYDAHGRAVAALGHTPVLVRRAGELTLEGADALDGLVLPGGESSTMLKLLARHGVDGPLDAFARSGRPLLATCAGMILSAREVLEPAQRSFGWLDITVARNAYGRQLDSFEGVADDGRTPLLFIRAPRILRLGEGVEVLATLDGEPVLVRQGSVTAAAFHPELTGDPAIHRSVFGEAG